MMSEPRFSKLLAQIYEAAADFGRWPEALRGIANAYDAPIVVFHAVGANQQSLWQLAPDVDPECHARYAAYYHHINPIIAIAIQSRVGEVLTDEMMMERQRFQRTEFFNDFLRPLEVGSMLGSAVYSDAGLYCAISVQRRRRFEEPSIALHRRLAPHLARAVQLNARLSALSQRSKVCSDTLDQLPQGAIVVDGDARVVFANREAERLAGPLGCLRIEAGRLRARSASLSAELEALIATCETPCEHQAGGTLSLRCEFDACAVSALVLPLRSEMPAFPLSPRPAAVVFVSKASQSPAPLAPELRRRFGLSGAEAALALEIISGDGLQASADRLGVSLSTARTHLARIFEKTGARRQAQLVRLLVT
jgi:DNA-binding CsgD family transcriptional regulator/PAS domain-containing protein